MKELSTVPRPQRQVQGGATQLELTEIKPISLGLLKHMEAPKPYTWPGRTGESFEQASPLVG